MKPKEIELEKKVEDAVYFGVDGGRLWNDLFSMEEFPCIDELSTFPDEGNELQEIYRAFLLYTDYHKNYHPDEDTLHRWSEEATGEVEYGMEVYHEKTVDIPASDIFIVFRWMAEHLKEYLGGMKE